MRLEILDETYINYEDYDNLLILQEADKVEDTVLLPLPKIDGMSFSDYYIDIENGGRVYSLKSNRFITTNPSKRTGYRYTCLTSDCATQKAMSVHSAVMMAYTQIEASEWQQMGLEIDHRNGKKEDCNVFNLRIVDRKTNMSNPNTLDNFTNRSTKRLTEDDVRLLRREWIVYRDEDKDYTEAVYCNKWSKMLGIGYEAVRNVILNKTYTDIVVEPVVEDIVDVEQIVLKQIKEQLSDIQEKHDMWNKRHNEQMDQISEIAASVAEINTQREITITY